ncbi:Multicopper oxidase type 2 [Penicillium angulare]|uniref:Multicopper oxidase type 2 n=1 Tax=Penicillium angulare TaxID=116970 RepID=A0A9W9FY94_9EURO|nr:Multicopper oxidase type 2 [Penicillium angulare]
MAPLKTLLALASMGVTPMAWAKLVHFNLDLTWEKGAPDGNVREMVFMNKQFPGPELRLHQGDDVEVTVHNHLPFNTSIHFHGIEQQGTPWSDGVPGLTQKPIQPGNTWTYRWKATQYGTYWYHSHGRSEMMDGLYGPIWIEPAPETPQPFHLISNNTADIAAMQKAELDPKLIILSDWDHLTFEEYQKIQEESGYSVFCMDSVLVNGRGAVYCPGGEKISSVELDYLKTAIDHSPLSDKGCLPNIYKTQGSFGGHDETRIPQGVNWGCEPTTGNHEIIEVDGNAGWVSLKFISAAALKSLIFSIDEHPMYIYEVDGSYVEPMLVHSAAIFNGERYAVMVKLDKPGKDYTLRVPDTQGDQVISGFATLRYKGSSNSQSSQPYVDYGGRNTSASVVALDQKGIHPYPPVTIPASADQLVNLTIGRWGSSYTFTTSGGGLWDMMANWDDPILYDLNAKNNLAPGLAIETKNGTWVDLLLQLGHMPNIPDITAPHVMHKHSNKAFILGVGPGFFEWSSTEQAVAAHPEYFGLENPQMRDTFVTQGTFGPTWMILRYQVVNPGPFLFHCHIETHMANGMAVALLDGVDAWPQLPPGEDQSPNPVPATPQGQSPVPTPVPTSTPHVQPASTPSVKPSSSSSRPYSSVVPSPTPSTKPSTPPSQSFTPAPPAYTPSSRPSTPIVQSSTPTATPSSSPIVPPPTPSAQPPSPPPAQTPNPLIEPPSPSWLARLHRLGDNGLVNKLLQRDEDTEEKHKPFPNEVTLIEAKKVPEKLTNSSHSPQSSKGRGRYQNRNW